MIESVEKGLDVGVYHPRPARPHRIPHDLQGVVGAALRAEPEATGQEIGLHDRLNDDLEGLLDHPIPHAGNTQRAHLPRLTRFRDPDPSHRLRTVSPVPQTDRHLVEETLDTSGLDVGDGDGVDAGGTPVSAHLQPRAPGNVHAVDPVEQRVETTIRRPLGRRVQLVLQGPSAVKGVVGLPAMHRLLPVITNTDEAGVLRYDGLCCPRRSPLIQPPPTTSRLDATSRMTVIRTGNSRAANPGPGRPSPVPASTFRTFHAPYGGGFLGAAFQDLHAFRGLHRDTRGSAPPCSPCGAGLTPRQASLHAADRSVAPPSQGS